MRLGQRFESARRLLTDSTSFSMRSPSSHRFAYLTLLRRRDPLQSGGRIGPLLEGMPISEVAWRMGTDQNALYKLLHDARKKLKRQMEASGLSAREVLAVFDEG